MLIAPDAFKGSLDPTAVARALADGWRRARPLDEVELIPLADGGEGTLVAITPVVGSARTVSAASKMAKAIGLAEVVAENR